MDSEFQRYVEHIQRRILSEGWEDVFAPASAKQWLKNSEQLLRSTMQGQGYCNEESLVHYFERLAREFEPKTRYDLPFTNEIFEPMLSKILEAADQLGLKGTRPIQIATSTDIGPSPLARPTSGSHLLFIGLGTSMFCNYWAKAFTAVVQSISRLNPNTRVLTAEDIIPGLKSDPSGIFLVCRLALYYAQHGTIMAFGRVLPTKESLAERGLLLEAMELFVVSHEFAHFVAEERFPGFRGLLDFQKAIELETFCDQLGISLCRHASGENFFAFAGVGAVTVFRALQLCESTRDLFIKAKGTRGKPNSADEMHPPIEARIAALKEHIRKTTDSDRREHVHCFTQEYDTIVKSTCDMVLQAVEQIVRRNTKQQ